MLRDMPDVSDPMNGRCDSDVYRREREKHESARAEEWLECHEQQPERYAELFYPGELGDPDSPF